MTKNDRFFKILFAVQIALLPLIMASYILMPKWAVGIFLAGALFVKIWLELFKNKQDVTHVRLLGLANALTILSLVIFFTIHNYINVVLCVLVVIFAVLHCLLKVVLNNRIMPEMVDAVDSCYVLFECLLLGGLAIVVLHTTVATVALYSLLLTSFVSVAYRLFYIWRHFSVWDKIKSIFRRK